MMNVSALTLPERLFALDCEMCLGMQNDKLLIKVAIVDSEGNVLLHELCRPDSPVSDYLTCIHGICEHEVSNAALSCAELQERVRAVLFGPNADARCTIVGHNVDVDLEVLLLRDLMHLVTVRDTAKFPLFQKWRAGSPCLLQRKLREVVKEVTSLEIQKHAHNPVEDAAAVMLLYLCIYPLWESQLQQRGSLDPWFKITPVIYGKSHDVHRLVLHTCEVRLPFVHAPAHAVGKTADEARCRALAVAWNVMRSNFVRSCVPRTRHIASAYMMSMFNRLFDAMHHGAFLPISAKDVTCTA